MRPQEIIAKKRDGKALSEVEIGIFVDGVVTGAWTDYQITALVMAMFLKGMTRSEQSSITMAMLHSGMVMDLADIDMPKGDKHSTGGVGDKTSLVIAPVLAACGVAVPMISGRGLGHTGGTLDKLEAIPGYNVRIGFASIKRIIKQCGLALAGQTKQIAPADRKIYALRDATATVPYIPLIVASIMSKKLAEGLDALVLDVKTGTGAFIQKLADSKVLAQELCATGNAAGVKTEALVTDMSEPLGKYVGNALETYECIKILRNESGSVMSATVELSTELTANLLVQCGVHRSAAMARKQIAQVLSDGSALEHFKRNIELQNGDASICDKPERLLTPGLHRTEIKANAAGYISDVDSLAVGEAVCAIGGGRVKASDVVDHAVGFECVSKVGDKVKRGDVVGVLFTRNAEQAASVSEKLKIAYKITSEPPKRSKLVRAKV